MFVKRAAPLRVVRVLSRELPIINEWAESRSGRTGGGPISNFMCLGHDWRELSSHSSAYSEWLPDTKLRKLPSTVAHI